MKIGVAGTGRMGAAVAGRLASQGHEIMVWNRSADKARATGFAVAPSPGALAGACEAVVSFLSDAQAVDKVYGEMLAGEVKGRLFIEMSTVRPEDSRRVGGKAKSKGAAFVDCPVGGSVGPAKEGKLFGFAGGEEADVARARPVLEQMCRRVEHVGPVGAGAAMKLAINLPLLVYWQALGEALALIQPLNLDPERIVSILADTSGGPNVLKTRGPAIAGLLAGRQPPMTVEIDTMRKDLREMLAEGRALGRALPVVERVLECYDGASRAGNGSKDIVTLPVSFAHAKG